jgi:ParB-like chromosome segregation protein Spo0J
MKTLTPERISEMSEDILIKVSEVYLIEQVNYRSISKRHIESLVSMNEPNEWPAIEVVTKAGRYGLVHGRHRLEAARILKLESIRAITRDDLESIEDINAEIVYDNLRHGLPATIDERKAEVIELHNEQPEMSYREIGRRVGLNHITVKRAIEGSSSSGYSNQSDDFIKPFARALKVAYENEKAAFSSKTSGRSTAKRAKALAELFSSVPDGKNMLLAGRDMCEAALKLWKPAK